MKTILVVDDEIANAEVLGMILTDEGYRVISASNGVEALARVADSSPDLLILDMMMPIMNGAEVGRSLKANPDTQHIKIIMNSSLSERAIREHFEEFDAFLRKPYLIDQLLTTMARLLAGD